MLRFFEKSHNFQKIVNILIFSDFSQNNDYFFFKVIILRFFWKKSELCEKSENNQKLEIIRKNLFDQIFLLNF